MVTYDKEDKKLIVPSSLGNFGNAGGGSGSGITPEEVQEMIDTSIEENNVELDVEFEDLSERISGNTEDIAALSGATSGMSSDISELSASTVALKEQVDNISLSGVTGDVEALSAATVNNTNRIDTLSGTVSDIRTDVNTLSGTTNNIISDVNNLSAATSGVASDIVALSGVTSGLSGQIGELSTNITALSGDTSALTASISALMANDNIAFFNLIKDYGDTNEELARLYDDMDAANTAGKTVVALSNFATGDTSNASVFATFRKDDNGGFYGAGSGVHYNGTTYIAARAVPIFRRDDYYNVIKKDGHFYFSDMGTIAPYTLPTAAANTKGGVKVGSGLTVNSETMSVKIGDGLGFSGDTLVVSGGSKEDIVLDAAEINNMGYNDRKALWDETYAKVLDGYKVFLRSEVHNKANNFAILPLVTYIPETNTETHSGGYLLFSAIDSTQNFYMYYSFSSAGNISGTGTGSGKVARNYIYSLPTAAANTLGGVKVGSGLTISSEKLSVKYGDGLGMSGDTLVVSGISGGDGWQWISEDEYNNWTSEEKEAWYDNILNECWNNDNFKFGVYQVIDKVSSADTGYDQMSVHYRTMVLNSIEAGYNSLHFSGAEFGAGDKNVNEWDARITRGGNWEVSTSSSSLELHASTFSLTSAGTAYGYFDSYSFNRSFDYAQTPGSYYAPAFNPILIYDGTPDTDPIGVGNVRLLANATDGTVVGGQDIKKAVIEFGVSGGDFYRAIGYSVGQNQEGYDVAGWHLLSCTPITF